MSNLRNHESEWVSLSMKAAEKTYLVPLERLVLYTMLRLSDPLHSRYLLVLSEEACFDWRLRKEEPKDNGNCRGGVAPIVSIDLPIWMTYERCQWHQVSGRYTAKGQCACVRYARSGSEKST